MGTSRSMIYALAEVLLAPIVAAALEPGPDLALQPAMVLVNTQLLFLSNMGDGSAHASNNLPVLLAGGGYKHSGHVAFDR